RRPVLPHPHHDTVGQLTADAGGAHPGTIAQPCLGGSRVDLPDVLARPDREGRAHLGRRQPPVMMDHDLAHGEVRMVLDDTEQRPGAPPRPPGARPGAGGRRPRPPRSVLTSPGVAYQLPTSRTSGSSHTPLRSHTARWASAISACTSTARARPSFTMKLAWRS